MLPVVSLEVPAEVPPTLAAIAVRACEATLGAGRCRLHSETSVADASWVATIVVSVETSGEFRIDLRRVESQPVQVRFSRNLTFEADEPEPQRWSTVGVVVAALTVSAFTSGTGQSSSSSAAPTGVPANSNESVFAQSTPAERALPPRSVVATHKTQIQPQHPSERANGGKVRLVLQMGYAGTDASPTLRVGALGVPSLMLSDAMFAWAATGFYVATRTVTTHVWTNAAGLGVIVAPSWQQFGFEGRFGFCTDFVTFRVERGSERDREARMRVGPTVGLDFRVALSRSLDLLVSANGAALFPRVRVNVKGNSVDELGLWQLSAGIGLRVWFGG